MLFYLILVRHYFCDALVDNQICRFPRVNAILQTFLNGLWGVSPGPGEEWKGNMADVVLKGESAKTSWIASTNYVFSKR